MPDLVPPHLLPAALDAHQPAIAAGPIVLRPFDATDAAWLVEVHRDPEIQRWHLRRFDDEGEARAWIERADAAWTAGTDGNWLVADAASGDRLGRVGLREIHLAWGVAECSYWVAPDARGRGVATQALRAVSRWAFAEVGLHRLTVTHSTANPASCRVATAAGFEPEGTARQAQRHLDGWHDKHLHARLATD